MSLVDLHLLLTYVGILRIYYTGLPSASLTSLAYRLAELVTGKIAQEKQTQNQRYQVFLNHVFVKFTEVAGT